MEGGRGRFLSFFYRKANDILHFCNWVSSIIFKRLRKNHSAYGQVTMPAEECFRLPENNSSVILNIVNKMVPFPRNNTQQIPGRKIIRVRTGHFRFCRISNCIQICSVLHTQLHTHNHNPKKRFYTLFINSRKNRLRSPANLLLSE